MPAGRDTAFVGVEYVLRNKGKSYPLNYGVFQEIEQILLQKYEGRPHWGKNSIPVFLDSKDRFPKWNDFLAVKQKMDPEGIFTNAFWERISTEASTTKFPALDKDNCVTSDTCYCSEDRHCPRGKKCMPGRWFKEANICR